MTSEIVYSAWANIDFLLYQLDPEVRRLEHLNLKILKKKKIRSIQTNLSIYLSIYHK